MASVAVGTTCVSQFQCSRDVSKLRRKTAADRMVLRPPTRQAAVRYSPGRVACSATPQDAVDVSRRQLMTAMGTGMLLSYIDLPALADQEVKKVFVAGATGQTGRRVVQQLRAKGIAVRAGVRDVKKAESLGLAFTREGGPSVELVKFDVTGAVDEIAAAIGDADAVICATGFTPTAGNWGGLKPGSSLPVEKEGTINLVAAAKKADIKHFVLVSSLLTNGADCNQTNNSNYKVLQAFGGVLSSKREAEVAVQRSGLDYTIVRPGGLSNDPPSGGIIAGGADTFFGLDSDPGREISRDSVAEVSIEALFAPAADKKIVEILGASGKATPKAGWFDFPEAPSTGCATPV
eukprot:CAMPEP_0118925594 /NCGR_PEP_ID=MMETSP1169-20130426/3458_1 /TAXON_ID=36882 /ORGANISM="Pyramimonas obovata, Strain CCMP722" /LENGTH=347 /DNA_ID=CAMNT_0006866941 /DNA_START=31 /DNA_END=1074 /DNA_ORIENTATION=-